MSKKWMTFWLVGSVISGVVTIAALAMGKSAQPRFGVGQVVNFGTVGPVKITAVFGAGPFTYNVVSTVAAGGQLLLNIPEAQLSPGAIQTT